MHNKVGQGGSESEGESSKISGSTQENQGEQSASQGGKQKEAENQSNTETNKITTTKMESKTILETNENEIDWKIIKSEIEKVNSSWNVLVLDLSSMNVDNNDILNFSATLNDSILSIKDENKNNTLINVAKLYSYIPKYATSISAANSTQNIKLMKSYLLTAYSLVEQEKWEEIETNITEMEKTLKNVLNDIEYMQDKEYKVNKIYVLIKELQNSLTYKDKKLFYIKYKDLVESINTL